jgi:hypothetical protein
MPAKHYRICINEDTLPLITFLNDGVEPVIKKKIQNPWFLFTIDSPREITVSRGSIKAEDDLYEADGKHMKDQYYKYESLIG